MRRKGKFLKNNKKKNAKIIKEVKSKDLLALVEIVKVFDRDS